MWVWIGTHDEYDKIVVYESVPGNARNSVVELCWRGLRTPLNAGVGRHEGAWMGLADTSLLLGDEVTQWTDASFC